MAVFPHELIIHALQLFIAIEKHVLIMAIHNLDTWGFKHFPVCASVLECVCVRVCVCARVHVRECGRPHVCASTCVGVCVCVCACACVCVHMCVCFVHAYVCIRARPGVRVCAMARWRCHHQGLS